MVNHSDIVYIIDRRGRTREILNADPGAADAASESSFSGLLAGQVRRIAHS
jgi:cytochrome oxidase Cu insertion factor (SCO1/SenC/PrrC family)